MNGIVFGYLLGSVVQTLILWRLAKAVERYRRGKVDLRNYINGVRGQLEVVRDNWLVMAKYALLSLALLIGVGFVLYQIATGGM